MKRSFCLIGFMSITIMAVTTAWAADASSEAAAKVYAAKCAACHGKQGQGNPAMAKAFQLNDPSKLSLVGPATQLKTDAELEKVTADGSGKMPAYKGKLSDAEIKDQVAYILTLAAAHPPTK